MKLAFYRMATTLGMPLIRLYLNRRLNRGKEDAARFDERLGFASMPRPEGPLVWLHAASVGESLSVLPLIDKLQSEYPAWSVLVTTGTVTSAKLMENRLPDGAIHQFVPVDCVSYVRRFLEHWTPDLALWVESEFWPNLVIETRARAVPMVVLNGRMSDSSYAKWQKNRFMIGRLLAAFKGVLAQSEIDGERFKALGAKAVSVPGNLKFAAPPLPVDDAALAELKTQIGDRPLWLAASTHPGEEALCGQVHQDLADAHPGLLTIIAPRHPERGGDVCAALRGAGLAVTQRSAGETINAATQVYVADTLGELGLFYRLSTIVFIGKTLVSTGGQNPIEPAQLSCALVFGPDMSNFADVAKNLLACGGARTVMDATELRHTIATLLDDAGTVTKMAQASATYAKSEAGVLGRIMDALSPYLSKDAPPMRAPEFWDRKSTGLLPSLLRPLGCLVGAIAAMRQKSTTPWKASVPVVCVGNLVAGGAGKTPVALDLVKRLAAKGVSVHVVTRGYGGKELGPIQVIPATHTSLDVGDEALLLADAAPTWVSKDRRKGCEAAINAGADIIIMDDGFQNPAVHKDLSLVVVDGGFGFGNARVMPAGPLRETVAAGLARADAVILIGTDDADVWGRVQRERKGLPVLRAKLTPVGNVEELRGQDVFAFAGIGRPEKFFKTLRDLGCKLVGARAFDDHHPYSKGEIVAILADAMDKPVFTTAKDHVRLSSEHRQKIHVLAIELNWKDDGQIDTLLAPLLTPKDTEITNG